MKLATVSCLIDSAAAFTPAHIGRTYTNLDANELDLGVTELPGVYDQLGFLETEPESLERRYKLSQAQVYL